MTQGLAEDIDIDGAQDIRVERRDQKTKAHAKRVYH